MLVPLICLVNLHVLGNILSELVYHGLPDTVQIFLAYAYHLTNSPESTIPVTSNLLNVNYILSQELRNMFNKVCREHSRRWKWKWGCGANGLHTPLLFEHGLFGS